MADLPVLASEIIAVAGGGFAWFVISKDGSENDRVCVVGKGFEPTRGAAEAAAQALRQEIEGVIAAITKSLMARFGDCVLTEERVGDMTRSLVALTTILPQLAEREQDD